VGLHHAFREGWLLTAALVLTIPAMMDDPAALAGLFSSSPTSFVPTLAGSTFGTCSAGGFGCNIQSYNCSPSHPWAKGFFPIVSLFDWTCQ
jgi:hypothetical protein